MQEKNRTKMTTVIPDSELYYERGGRAFDRGDIQKSKEAFEIGASLAESEEDWAYGICQLALLHQYTDDIAASMELLDEAMRYQSAVYPELFYFQANNYAFLENYEKALSLTRYYLLMDPNGEYAEEAKEFVKMIQMETPVRPL